MPKTQISVFLGLAIVLPLAGCGASKESQLEGKWKLQSMNGQAAPPQSSSTPMYEFKPDKHFTVGTGAMAEQGDWAIKDGAVELTITSIGGQSIADLQKNLEQLKPKGSQSANTQSIIDSMSHQKATLSEDGKTLTLVMPQGFGTLVLAKA